MPGRDLGLGHVRKTQAVPVENMSPPRNLYAEMTHDPLTMNVPICSISLFVSLSLSLLCPFNMHHIHLTPGEPHAYWANHGKESMETLIYGGSYVADGLEK
jgi:hypothetical protein